MKSRLRQTPNKFVWTRTRSARYRIFANHHVDTDIEEAVTETSVRIWDWIARAVVARCFLTFRRCFGHLNVCRWEFIHVLYGVFPLWMGVARSLFHIKRRVLTTVVSLAEIATAHKDTKMNSLVSIINSSFLYTTYFFLFFNVVRILESRQLCLFHYIFF